MNQINLSQNEQINKEYKWESNSDSKFNFFPIDNNISIIIGANNSRKSRFLRHLFKEEGFLTSNENITDLIDKFEKTLYEVTLRFEKGFYSIRQGKLDESDRLFLSNTSGFRQLEEYLKLNLEPTYDIFPSFFKDLGKNVQEITSSPSQEDIDTFITSLKEAYTIVSLLWVFSGLKNNSSLLNHVKIASLDNVHPLHVIKNQLRDLREVITSFFDFNLQFLTPKITYIPTLRGSLSLLEAHDKRVGTSVYEYTFRNNHKLQAKSNRKIFTGLDLYYQIRKSRNSPKEVRLKFEAFENFLKKYFFNGKDIDIIALDEQNNSTPTIQIYIKDDSDRELYNMGDGIQSLIILIYPLFIASKDEWFFIEEPELNMHPGLQTLFLKAISEDVYLQKKNLKIFITTHSNHLLDNILEKSNHISIYSFEKRINESSDFTYLKPIINSENHILELLGVKNSSVFLSNCTIWVEGICDRLYLLAFLKAFFMCNSNIKEYLENYHFSFYEYAGSNLTHYLFEETENGEHQKIKAHFLSNRIFLLADRDKNKEDKHHEYLSLNKKDEYRFIYQHTGAIEIENLLSHSILKKIITDYFKIEPVINIKEVEYENIRLGEFFDQRINPLLNKKRVFKDKSGTLKTYYKNIFSEFVLDGVNDGTITWDMICQNEHAKNLTTILYKFLKNNN